MNLVVRTAQAADLPALTALRWRWARADEVASPEVLREFGADLERWMTAQGDASVCQLAVLDGALVGMAWLAVFDRVPNPGDLTRRSGDVQSVFVLPGHRGLGIGRRLMEAICATADARGVRKLTVDSREETVRFYEALGFTSTGTLLQRTGQ
ncbi:ribosomal protein S18 acetylase RimI-like enzyme [Kribbella amoyensis]|uniref:Ribosomal protein S18 acetylase RimI-like enzyme n=1 Tax=Kribbella amoyensis TaxID=996641 RepID=A0A561BUQ3_9ACTN|nr:GNAT family N-acetyltransferase [Kribbella amoyensis]TWD82650.1 ribosomal protein S18 acetylase RimI-like enzyme [Kribbella amoyensis]